MKRPDARRRRIGRGFEPALRRVGSASELREQVVGFPVIVEIDEEGELGWADGIDEVLHSPSVLPGFFIHTMRRAK